MSCAVRVGFSPRGARAIQYAVPSATDDDKAVKPLDKQILEIFGCRSNNQPQTCLKPFPSIPYTCNQEDEA